MRLRDERASMPESGSCMRNEPPTSSGSNAGAQQGKASNLVERFLNNMACGLAQSVRFADLNSRGIKVVAQRSSFNAAALCRLALSQAAGSMYGPCATSRRSVWRKT